MSSSTPRRSADNAVDDRTLDDALLSVVQRYPDGLLAREAQRLLPAPYKSSQARVEARLRELAQTGRIQRWGGQSYAPGLYAERAEPAMIHALAQRPLSSYQLKLALPAAMRQDPPALQRLLDAAVGAGRVYLHPDPKKTKGTARYALVPADPARYLTSIEKALSLMVKRLKRSGIGRAELLAALSGTPAPPRAAGAATARSPEPAAEARRFFQAVLEVRPDAPLHVLVSVRDLRRHLGWAKQDFDQLVLELARSGRIVLHHHDHPAGLSPEARDELVSDGRGNHYIGLVLESP